MGLTEEVRRIRNCGGRPRVGVWGGTGKVGGEPGHEGPAFLLDFLAAKMYRMC